jgi:hypothetical protein
MNLEMNYYDFGKCVQYKPEITYFKTGECSAIQVWY